MYFLAAPTGVFWINAYYGGSDSFRYSAMKWYRIELKDFDFISKSFDFYVNSQLIKANIPFRWADEVENVYSIELYNYSAGSEAWWDEIYLSKEKSIDWLSAAPFDNVIPPDSSIDIAIDFDAGGLELGEYEGLINIHTNDIDNYLVTIPAFMLVDSALDGLMILPLSDGWNLVSWNINPPGDSVTTLFAPVMNQVEVVHGFGSGGLAFSPNIPPAFNTLATIGTGRGCFIKMNGPDTLIINGSRIQTQEPIPIQPGYNLIGYFPDAPDSVGHALESVMPNT